MSIPARARIGEVAACSPCATANQAKLGRRVKSVRNDSGFASNARLRFGFAGGLRFGGTTSAFIAPISFCGLADCRAGAAVIRAAGPFAVADASASRLADVVAATAAAGVAMSRLVSVKPIHSTTAAMALLRERTT